MLSRLLAMLRRGAGPAPAPVGSARVRSFEDRHPLTPLVRAFRDPEFAVASYAPEAIADPTLIGEIEAIRRRDLENNEAHLGARDLRTAGLDGMVNVFPRAGAVRGELIELGRELDAWMGRHPDDVEGVEWLDHLLAGRYPPEEVYMGCINGRTLVAPPWELCPVVVRGRGRLFEAEHLMRCLYAELPRHVYGRIGNVYPD